MPDDKERALDETYASLASRTGFFLRVERDGIWGTVAIEEMTDSELVRHFTTVGHEEAVRWIVFLVQHRRTSVAKPAKARPSSVSVALTITLVHAQLSGPLLYFCDRAKYEPERNEEASLAATLADARTTLRRILSTIEGGTV